ncbi:unnamed protein product [Arabidopsis lyrata]|uniref:Predicted protein n=1 Tax=Arabidopsis lyrata subsp. lyrata TaxID=81972 RepID=D7MH18_ARALL|nr:predicted protein [Arabidopsis lyrata subsp. lyrata]CAH8276708.1 unnamed protein product [Arabidopsis lyrata]
MSLAGSSGTGYSGSAFAPSSVGRIFPAVPSRDSNLPSQNYLDARSNQAGKAFQQNSSIYSGGSSGTGHSPASYNGFTGRTSARSRVSGSHSGISGSHSRRSPSVEETFPSNSSVAPSSRDSPNQVNDPWPFNNDQYPFGW